MHNFVNEAVMGKSVGSNFFDELTASPIIKVVLFIGSICVAGYFTIMFFKEASSILPRARFE